jgi:hypothetical protein
MSDNNMTELTESECDGVEGGLVHYVLALYGVLSIAVNASEIFEGIREGYAATRNP